MKKAATILLIFLLSVQCTEKPANKSVENAVPGKSNSDERKTAPSGKFADCTVIRKHAFSNPDKEDTFKIQYHCNNLEDSMLFEIVSFSGETIYSRKFSGTAFYDYGRPWYMYITDPERGADFDPDKLGKHVSDSLHQADLGYIKERMNAFFSDESFMKNPGKNLHKDHLNISDFKGIQDDPTAVGFSYKLFEGGGFEMLAYSKKLRAVKLIASSD